MSTGTAELRVSGEKSLTLICPKLDDKTALTCLSMFSQFKLHRVSELTMISGIRIKIEIKPHSISHCMSMPKKRTFNFDRGVSSFGTETV